MNHLEGDCLKANKLWTAIAVITPMQAIKDAAAGAVTLIKVIDGYPVSMTLDEWVTLEPKDGEDYIQLAHSKRIPVPRAVVCNVYDKFRAKAVPFNLKNLAKRYNYVCAVTNKPLREEEYSSEHVRPKSKGGKNGWENEVLMDRKTNNKRGNRSYRKLGLKKPSVRGEPPPLLPINSISNTHGYPEWAMFGIQ